MTLVRRTLRTLLAPSLAAGLAACGGTPPPKPDPQVEKKPEVEEQLVNGIPKAAVDAFVEGVAALKKSPPDYAAAAAAFEAATKAHPDYVVGLLNLAYSYEKLGRYAEAASAYQRLIKKGVIDNRVTLALGRARLLSGEVDAAITEFESVLRAEPDSLEARNNLAAAYLAKGDLDTSLRYVKEVLAVQPKNVPGIINLGLIYLEQERLPLALLMFNKALGYEEKNARAHNNLGLTFYALDDIPAAVLEFEKAISLDPTLDEARMNLGSIYLDYLDYASALAQFQAVRARFPKHYEAMVGEADALYGTGEYEKAAALYAESLEIRPDNAEALLRAGKIYEEQLGKPKEALAYYLRYRDVAKPPPDDRIHQTIQFLQQADQLQLQPMGAEEGAGAEATTAAGGEAAGAGDEAATATGAGDEAAAEEETAAPAEGTDGDGVAAPEGGDGETAPSDDAAPAGDPEAGAETPEAAGAAPAEG